MRTTRCPECYCNQSELSHSDLRTRIRIFLSASRVQHRVTALPRRETLDEKQWHNSSRTLRSAGEVRVQYLMTSCLNPRAAASTDSTASGEGAQNSTVESLRIHDSCPSFHHDTVLSDSVASNSSYSGPTNCWRCASFQTSCVLPQIVIRASYQQLDMCNRIGCGTVLALLYCVWNSAVRREMAGDASRNLGNKLTSQLTGLFKSVISPRQFLTVLPLHLEVTVTRSAASTDHQRTLSRCIPDETRQLSHVTQKAHM